MTDCYIFDHCRSPRGRGKPDGALHTVTALELARQMLAALKARNGLDEDQLDDVILGIVEPVGEQAAVLPRIAALLAGLGRDVPGVQINRFCASGLEAVNMAAAKVMAGQADLIVGGGVECMGRVPLGASGGAWSADPQSAFGLHFVPQGISADLIATIHGFSREELDRFAVESQHRAGRAWHEGRFKGAIVPVTDHLGQVLLDRDEHMRPDTNMQSLAGLKASFAGIGADPGFDQVALLRYPELPDIRHVHHAGNSSGIVDGCGLVLLGTKEAGQALGLRPRARIRATAALGSEPTIMLTGPEAVSRKALARAGMEPGDIDLWELNEAFAAVVLLYQRAFGLPPAKLNVCGGAIAMGHPVGATGAMILGILLDELERTGQATGLANLCVGAGMGAATIIERV